jgi:ABC-type antimicrobial peptide transport system permease subunit
MRLAFVVVGDVCRDGAAKVVFGQEDEVVQALPPLSDGMLEGLQELGSESGGFMEEEAVGWGFGVLVRVDPGTYVGVTACFLVVALGACILPAWRALKVDPVEAFRAE